MNREDRNLMDSIKYTLESKKDSKYIVEKNLIMFTIGKEDLDGHLNGAYIFKDENVEEDLATVENFFKRLKKGYVIWTRDTINLKLEEILKNKGYYPNRIPGSAIMVIDKKIEDDLIDGEYTDVSIEKVDTDEKRADFSKVVKDAFKKEEDLSKLMFENLGKRNIENVEGYIMYEQNTPVGSVRITYSEDIAGIYWVGTTEAKRGKGYGKKIVQKATNRCMDKGFKKVILQASEMGEKLYKKLNYETIGYYRTYKIDRGA